MRKNTSTRRRKTVPPVYQGPVHLPALSPEIQRHKKCQIISGISESICNAYPLYSFDKDFSS